MRQHHKNRQCSGKTKRRRRWEKGKEILAKMLEERREKTDAPLTKRERRFMFVEARKRALT